MAHDSNPVYTCCPVVRREPAVLAQRVEVAGEYRNVTYERELLWVRQTESRLVASHKGVELKTFSQCWDYYGLATSWAHDDAVPLARRLRIDVASTLVVEVQGRVIETPLLEDASPEGVEHNANPRRQRRYRSVPSDARRAGPDGGQGQRVAEVELQAWEVVWSSAVDGLSTMPRRLLDRINGIRADAGLGPAELEVHESPLPPAGQGGQ